ncbi:3-ketodihydrosphingosine reductase-like isoform X2 [Pomacea canaliculata]|uniref:3-ketodihydrosphingosine reductase-like isoform X2 n=1 Tax=Pomacea canaliculata TaxID=400727 RepID=UPI000D726815|nr:3-ketodihydrosphingosine reductase-like isoform X2 [Pomacea canaliculata]
MLQPYICGKPLFPSERLSPSSRVLGRESGEVTGGSSGIGKCMAIEAAKGGARVTLVARDQLRLQKAKSEVESHMTRECSQMVVCLSLDISMNLSDVERAVKEAEETQGPVDVLINCAGTSMSAKFLDTPLIEFRRMMEINYLGSVMVTRAVVPSMIKKKSGRIVFVSSMAGQLGLFGYTAYSSSKFALRGFAESLQMELKPYNIKVTLAFPPDTDTPGFAEEQKIKPKETRLLSEAGGLFQPDTVAKIILKDSLKGKFLSSVGIDGFMVSTLTCGFSPATSFMEGLSQVTLMGLFRLIALSYLAYFDYVIKKCKDEDEIKSVKKSS